VAAFEHKDLLSINQLSVLDINLILEVANSLKELIYRDIKKVPTLRGKSIINFFYEPSTRTRVSFEMAAKILGADTISISASTSSMVKGETLIDTAKNLEAMNPDVIVIRHSSAGVPHLIASKIKPSVINAGDGINEHPTQALLDLFTINEKKGGDVKGIEVAIIGDIAHSRVAKSDILILKKMGANVTVCGPPTMIPVGIESMGVNVCYDPSEAVKGKDVLICLRIQLERQSKNIFPSLREYAFFFGINKDLIKLTKSDAIIMHPGPMNRGVEIMSDVADSGRSVILDQVTNGVAVRMAILYLLIGGQK